MKSKRILNKSIKTRKTKPKKKKRKERQDKFFFQFRRARVI